MNKNIIEISDTGNDCFERAILFVRPDKAGDCESIDRRAKGYLAGIRIRPWFYPRGRKLLLGLGFLAAAALGAAVTAALLLL